MMLTIDSNPDTIKLKRVNDESAWFTRAAADRMPLSALSIRLNAFADWRDAFSADCPIFSCDFETFSAPSVSPTVLTFTIVSQLSAIPAAAN